MPLTFFVELATPELEALFERPEVLPGLQRAGAGVAVATLDLSSRRADTLARVQRSGVPITAWIVLELEDGYWLTADNAERAVERYRAVRDWAARAGIELAAIGLDVELPGTDAVALLEDGLRAALRMLGRVRSRELVRGAATRYAQLLGEIRRDGFVVETYQFPLILDERRAGSTLLQRSIGLVDMVADREVLMIYRSLLPDLLGRTLVDAFGGEAEAIAVGLTGGGASFLRKLNPTARRLTLEQLLVELRRARRYTDRLYVFSLEGTVEAGYFDALCRADLSQQVAPVSQSALVGVARGGLRAMLAGERIWDRLLFGS